MLKHIGYTPPQKGLIDFFHNDFFQLIEKNVPDVSKIICACCCTMDDKNGESLGLFFALPDRFVYVASVVEKEQIMYVEFLIDEISKFSVLAKDDQFYSIQFEIYGEDILVEGYDMQIPDDFLNRLKISEIISLDLN